MHRRSYVYLIAAAALACGLARAAQWTKTYNVAGRPELRVETNDGSITIHTWDQKRIEAVVITKGWNIGAGEVQIHERQIGDRIEFEARVPSLHVDFLNFESRSLHIDLHVPRDTRTDVRSGDGSVEVSGLQGDIRINTGDGSIRAAGVDGALDARTGDGSVHADGRFESLNVHTGDGSVEVNAAPGSHVSSAWRIETGDGSVNVRLPGQLSADLDVRTGDGSLNVDLPLAMKTANTGEDRKELHGKLNGGGQPLYVRTGDGGIHIRGL
ncbi:MAG: DUF4097 family beta strand repeat-containing protein [Bryobacteraceae bacterium]|jgi:DUF4097 and DUF4098 domain-containing protein YvlB